MNVLNYDEISFDDLEFHYLFVGKFSSCYPAIETGVTIIDLHRRPASIEFLCQSANSHNSRVVTLNSSLSNLLLNYNPDLKSNLK